MLKRLMLAAVLSAVAGQAAAQGARERPVDLGEPAQGYAFYNRPGATLADHDAELAHCIAVTSTGDIRYPGEGLAIRLLWDAFVQGADAAKVENCMIVRGWRVFQLDSRQGTATARLSTEAFIEQVTPWVGAATPPGVMTRAFANEVSHPNTWSTASRPRPPSRDHISLRLFADSGITVATPAIDLRAIMRQPRAKTLRLRQLPEPAPGHAIVVMRLSGTHYALAFEQDVEDSAPLGQSFGAMPSRDGRWIAVEVPAGRWRIARIQSLILCFGSPAFEVAPGEVVYAGHFDTAGAQLGPDLDLSPVRAAVQGPPVGRLRPAVYRNGSTGDCNVPAVGYALEFPDAPFEPGYRGGSSSAAPAAP